MNDKEIIALFFSRDEKAIDECRTLYGAYLLSISGSILRDARDSEECVADVLLEAWDSIPPRDPGDLKAYLGTICRNRALNRFRDDTRQKRGNGALEAAYEELEECVPGEQGGRFAESIALKDAINRFLKGLSRQARVIFVQKYWYMFSISEIAKDLGMRENAVKASLFRTRKKLREHLKKEGFEE